jgi:RNA polymerase sigma factor (sigma-70 family)
VVQSSASDATDERFADTAWSIVLAAGASTPARTQTAMAELCRIYWRPIYAYLRRSGYSTHDAEDLTQSFFQHLLENETLQRASRERGRFRSFLLGTLKRCLADEHMQQHTLKRGGGMQFVSANELEAEELHHLRADYEAAPDEILDARWAGVLLERALEKVRLEFDAEEKAKTFQLLSPFLAGEKPTTSYEEIAKVLGVSLGAVKTQIHRLRRRFAAAVRSEIMQTVAAPHEVENELRQLRSVFARLAKQSAL